MFLGGLSALVIPGYLFSKGNGAFPAGHGAEVSLQFYRDSMGSKPLEMGLFGQAQSFGDGARYAGGLQFNSPYLFFSGVELGGARRGAQSGYGTTTSAHLGLFISLAYVNVGFRWDIPVSTSGPSPGIDRAFFVSLKFPLLVVCTGEFVLPFSVCEGLSPLGRGGRPLEVEREARVAPLARGEGWG